MATCTSSRWVSPPQWTRGRTQRRSRDVQRPNIPGRFSLARIFCMQPAVVKPLFLTTAWTTYFSPESHYFHCRSPKTPFPCLAMLCEANFAASRAKSSLLTRRSASAGRESRRPMEISSERSRKRCSFFSCWSWSNLAANELRTALDVPKPVCIAESLCFACTCLHNQQGGLLTELLQKGRHGDVSTIHKIRHAGLPENCLSEHFKTDMLALES